MKHCTTINFTLDKSAMAIVIIYNTLGETIVTPLSKELPSGNHSVVFDASNLPSGIYFYSLQTAEHTPHVKCCW